MLLSAAFAAQEGTGISHKKTLRETASRAPLVNIRVWKGKLAAFAALRVNIRVSKGRRDALIALQ